MKFKLHYTAALLLFFSFSFAHSENDDSDEAAEAKQLEELAKETKGIDDIPIYQIREPGERAFAIYCPTRPATELFYVRGEKTEAVQYNTEAVRTFQYTNQGVIILYKRIAPGDSKESLKPVFQATPSAGSNDGILILDQKNLDPEKPIQIPYIDISSQVLSKGAARLVNLTSRPLLVQLGDNKKSVEPFAGITHTFGTKENFYPVTIGLRVEEETRLIYRNTLQTEQHSRVLFLVIPNTDSSKQKRPVRCMVYKDMGKVD